MKKPFRYVYYEVNSNGLGRSRRSGNFSTLEKMQKNLRETYNWAKYYGCQMVDLVVLKESKTIAKCNVVNLPTLAR